MLDLLVMIYLKDLENIIQIIKGLQVAFLIGVSLTLKSLIRKPMP